MKKSQALAALAFAFALGVIAPVATTVSAFEVDTDQNGLAISATGTATCAEQNKAVRTIKSHANYQWYVDLAAVDAEYTAGNYRDITSAANLAWYFGTGSGTGKITLAGGSGNTTDIADLQAAINRVSSRVLATAADGTTLYNNTIANTPTLLSITQSDDFYYTYFKNLNDAIADPTHANLNNAVNAFRANVPGASNLQGDPQFFIRDYVNANAVDTYYGTGVLGWYKSIQTRVTDTTDEYNDAVAGKMAYEGLLSRRGVLSDPSGTTDYATYDKDTNATVVTDLYNIAHNSNAADPQIAINGNWKVFYDNYETYVACDEATDTLPTNSHFMFIWHIADLYKYAINNSTANTKDIAEYLINYVPADDGDDDTTGTIPGGSDGSGSTTDGDKSSTDDKKDDTKKPVSAGNQGAIATSAASASKSAGIMASIATALTTAGAGIVAYRNNRRSSKKEA